MTAKPKQPVADMGIVARLENWGWCQRGRTGGAMISKETRSTSPYGGQGYKCMTNTVCTIMREAANGPAPSRTAQSRLDFNDAAIIQSAWQKLSIRHQLLLKDLYVFDKAVNTICRQLTIRHTPGHHWNSELKSAQDAIFWIASQN